MLFGVLNLEESVQCMGCDKEGRECLVIMTEAYTGPHCIKCVMREARKRSKNAAPKDAPTLFDGRTG